MRTCTAESGGRSLAVVEVAETPWERMRGLLGRTGLPERRAMYLAPCSAVHTFFMNFPLDLVFLARGGEVVRIVRAVPRNRFVFGGPGAAGVLEMAAGWLPGHALSPGDRVALSDGPT